MRVVALALCNPETHTFVAVPGGRAGPSGGTCLGTRDAQVHDHLDPPCMIEIVPSRSMRGMRRL